MEQWKDIPGYKGRYQASTAGRVRSLDREVFVKYAIGPKAGTTVLRPLKGRFLRPRSDIRGYKYVGLGTKHKSKRVHRLVMLTFVGPCPVGCEVLHLNHCRADNRQSNLKYGTRSENLKMDYKNGSRQYLKVAL